MGRYFEGGAYRDDDDYKMDPEGFLSPLVVEAFSEYMHEHRRQSDGHMRDSDNWQKGMPEDVCMKSAWRHFLDLWKEHRHYQSREGFDAAMGGLLFNLMAIWHYRLRERASSD